MDIVDRLAEERIQEALKRGELDNLPGAGKPLLLDDDQEVPAELRTAYRLLKNAGYLPPELALHRELRAVEDLLPHVEDEAERRRAWRRLECLTARLGATRRGEALLSQPGEYQDSILQRLAS